MNQLSGCKENQTPEKAISHLTDGSGFLLVSQSNRALHDNANLSDRYEELFCRKLLKEIGMPENTAATGATMIPTMRYHDTPAAIEWLCEAFGFQETSHRAR